MKISPSAGIDPTFLEQGNALYDKVIKFLKGKRYDFMKHVPDEIDHEDLENYVATLPEAIIDDDDYANHIASVHTTSSGNIFIQTDDGLSVNIEQLSLIDICQLCDLIIDGHNYKKYIESL